MAERVDRYELYEEAVHDPEAEVEFYSADVSGRCAAARR